MRRTIGLPALGLLALLFCSPVWDQDLLIANARIVDGNGGVIENGSVAVQDGEIVVDNR